MFLWDPTIVILIPAVIVMLYAQFKVSSAVGRYSKVRASSGLRGAEIARLLLERGGLFDVKIEPTRGFLGDHYDPRSKTLRLSPNVYSSDSVAAVSIAAHETGHAFQHAHAYAPLGLRSLLYPAAAGSNLAPFLFIIGLFMSNNLMINAALILFAAAAIFTLVTLPVEYNASSRALALLAENGVIVQQEAPGVRAVLNAAALTYVAAALMAILQLLRFWLIAQGRRD